MKKCLIALLVMVGLVGGLVIAGCGRPEQKPPEQTTQKTMEKGAGGAVESATKTAP